MTGIEAAAASWMAFTMSASSESRSSYGVRG